MKLLAICGSPRKGNSYKALGTIRDAFPDIDLEILQLYEMNFSLCRGCYSCVLKGESRCPIKDDKDLMAADYIHYKDKATYFYDTKRVSDKIISGID